MPHLFKTAPRPCDIAIGIPCREQGRWTPFWQCVEDLERPEGLITRVYPEYNNSVAQARNNIVMEAMGRDGAQAIFWLDDDMIFEPDVLVKLLRRPESIVIGLTLMRCFIDHANMFRPIWSTKEFDGHDYVPVDEIKTGANGLMELKSGTGGGVLTRRDVFDGTPKPWWQMGQFVPDMFWEDTFFYKRVRDYGFTVWGDPSVRFGHYSSMVIWPVDTPHGWNAGLALGAWDVFIQRPLFENKTAPVREEEPVCLS